jgi:hypothetical protein
MESAAVPAAGVPAASKPVDPAVVAETRKDELTTLRHAAWGVLATLAVVAVGCLVGVIFLLPLHLASTDVRRLVIISALGGALGSAVSALTSTCDRIGAGFELEDGTKWPQKNPPGKFVMRMVPWLLVRPVFGAVMGTLLFAGFVGGFLIATTQTPKQFSPAGLLFLSLLSGLFAKTFVARLRVMFKTLLGDTEETAKSGDDAEDAGAAEKAKRTRQPAAGTASAPARGAPGT